MKNRYMNMIAFTLSAALLFIGCAGTQTNSYAAVSIDSKEVSSQLSENSNSNTAETVKVQLNKTGIECSDEGVEITDSNAVIKKAGTYILSGTLDNGSIIVDAGKEDKVQLVLSGVKINSDSFAAIYVRQADAVSLTLADGTENTLAGSGAFSQIDENDVDTRARKGTY